MFCPPLFIFYFIGTWKIGDTVQIGDETLTIAGLLKNDPFSAVSYTHLDLYKRQRETRPAIL